MFWNIFVSFVFGILFARVVELWRGLDLYKASLCLRIYHSALFKFVLLAKGTWHREDDTTQITLRSDLYSLK